MATTGFENQYGSTVPLYPSVHTTSHWHSSYYICYSSKLHQLLVIIKYLVHVQTSRFFSLFGLNRSPRICPYNIQLCLFICNSFCLRSLVLSTFTRSRTHVICLQNAKSSGLGFSFLSSLSPLSSRRLNWIWEIISDSWLLHNQVTDKQGWNSASLLSSIEPYIVWRKGTASWLPGDNLSWESIVLSGWGTLAVLPLKQEIDGNLPWNIKSDLELKCKLGMMTHTCGPSIGGWRISSLKQAWVTQQDCILHTIKKYRDET